MIQCNFGLWTEITQTALNLDDNHSWVLRTDLHIPFPEFQFMRVGPRAKKWYNCRAQQTEFTADFLQWDQYSAQKKRSPAAIQILLKEQRHHSKTAKCLSPQPVCYVIMEFGKYYVSEQLKIPQISYFH